MSHNFKCISWVWNHIAFQAHVTITDCLPIAFSNKLIVLNTDSDVFRYKAKNFSSWAVSKVNVITYIVFYHWVLSQKTCFVGICFHLLCTWEASDLLCSSNQHPNISTCLSSPKQMCDWCDWGTNLCQFTFGCLQFQIGSNWHCCNLKLKLLDGALVVCMSICCKYMFLELLHTDKIR